MPKINITKTELVWLGKYDEEGKLNPVEKPGPYPFQIVEVINKPRTGKEIPTPGLLFDLYEGKEGNTFEEGWRNKLIWGDNKLVMSSLLEKFAGRINLIYIDPPFATGADFKFKIQIGEEAEEITKEHSIIEEKAYRDTWGKGLDSYLQMMYERLVLMKELLAENGSIYVHLDWHVGHYVKVMMDEIFGYENFRNEIVVGAREKHTHSQFGYLSSLSNSYQIILLYVKNQDTKLKLTKRKVEPKKERWSTLITSYGDRPTMRFEIEGVKPIPPDRWKWSEERIKKALENYEKYKDNLKNAPEDIDIARVRISPASKYGKVVEYYLRETEEEELTNNWTDIQAQSSLIGYDTEKNEFLLKRIIEISSNPGDIVADFFCGSGTTLAVAEKLGRRWIGSDLSRYAIHITRKRLLEIENSKDLTDEEGKRKYGRKAKPFEILNLGKYERQIWQVKTFSNKDEKQALFEYLAFILKLYGAEPISGFTHIHGKKGSALVYVGAVDAPVTIQEVTDAIQDCKKAEQKELHILGWEWEMGLNDAIQEIAKREGVRLKLRIIPMDVLDSEAVRRRDIQFFELAHFKVDIKTKGKNVEVELKDFVIPHTDFIPDDVKDKIKKWTDWIDYWAVDFDFKNDTFNNGWTSYRTKKDRTLNLKATYTYEKAGKYKIFVKVIDIFGIDTSQIYEVEVR
ncbi:adenine-specific DNA-methyltransferase [Desulfurella multipotens]|uniref:site-specific DNA-methyltransferase (adenine-specific) n=1 Tax=Desulfurella multipotens TaxID=79269 RepID=A0A1G6RXM9_9BACT|nr:site-specific DNA-methyltransferase [Desulfurella multipotens]SDD08717.1 adenine-specific DNA-methyltransferase [Desulfurella multipotens]